MKHCGVNSFTAGCVLVIAVPFFSSSGKHNDFLKSVIKTGRYTSPGGIYNRECKGILIAVGYEAIIQVRRGWFSCHRHDFTQLFTSIRIISSDLEGK